MGNPEDREQPVTDSPSPPEALLPPWQETGSVQEGNSGWSVLWKLSLFWFILNGFTTASLVWAVDVLERFGANAFQQPGPMRSFGLAAGIGLACFAAQLQFGQTLYLLVIRLVVDAFRSWYPSPKRLWLILLIVSFVIIMLPPLFPLWLVHLLGFDNQVVLAAVLSQSPLFFGLLSTFLLDPRTNPSRAVLAPSQEGLVLPSTCDAKGFEVVHLSDLHLTAGESSVEDGPSPDPRFVALCEQHQTVLSDAQIVLVTGDMTDAGKPKEWKAFFTTYPADLLNKSVMIPGNHDINIVSRTKSRVEDPDFRCKCLRLIRMISALEKVQGKRAWIINPDRKKQRLSDFLAPFMYRMNRFLESPGPIRTSRPNSEPELAADKKYLTNTSPIEHAILSIWAWMFPMAVEVSPRLPVVYAFNTNYPSISILDNAFGKVDTEDESSPLERLELLRAKFPGRPALYALHHHLVLPFRGKGAYSWIQTRGMVLTDATKTYEAIRKGQPTVVFHGHRHIHYIFRLEGDVEVVGAPSTTLGDVVHNIRPGFYKYTILRSNSGSGARLGAAEFHPI